MTSITSNNDEPVSLGVPSSEFRVPRSGFNAGRRRRRPHARWPESFARQDCN
jgi:hypothetical protein